MAEVKWIKIVTDIFDDEKILMIESMPEADSLIVIWFKLLCLAGKQNNSGVLMLGRMPYTDEMFSTIFRRPINTVRLALQTFEGFGMIEIINNTVTIPNWNKHQSLDQLESKKQYMRTYMAEYREKQKALTSGERACKTNSKTNGKTNGKTNVSCTDIDKEKDIEKDTEREENIASAATPPKNPTRHKYGMYNNVLLSDDDMEKLQTEFPHDYSDRIERLSEYIASTGKSYKSHLATIRSWARKEASTAKPTDNNSFNEDEFFGQAVQRSKRQKASSNPFLEMLKNGEV